MSKTIQLIGVPTDISAGARGASMGPEALRVAGIESMLRAHHLQVEDSGNLVGPANPWLPPTDGYRHLEQVRQWNQSLHEAYYEALKNGRLPITLGGDHCLGIGSISAAAAWAILVMVMHADWVALPGIAAATLGICVVASLLAGFAGTFAAMRAKAAPLLRGE